MVEPTTNKNDTYKKYEILYIRLCSKQTADYVKCLNNDYQDGIDCEELRKKYVSCINSNNNNNNI